MMFIASDSDFLLKNSANYYCYLANLILLHSRFSLVTRRNGGGQAKADNETNDIRFEEISG